MFLHEAERVEAVHLPAVDRADAVGETVAGVGRAIVRVAERQRLAVARLAGRGAVGAGEGAEHRVERAVLLDRNTMCLILARAAATTARVARRRKPAGLHRTRIERTGRGRGRTCRRTRRCHATAASSDATAAARARRPRREGAGPDIRARVAKWGKARAGQDGGPCDVAFVILLAIAAAPVLRPEPGLPARYRRAATASSGQTAVSAAPAERTRAPAPRRRARDRSRFLIYDRPALARSPSDRLEPVTNDWGQALWLPVVAGRVDGAGDRWFASGCRSGPTARSAGCAPATSPRARSRAHRGRSVRASARAPGGPARGRRRFRSPSARRPTPTPPGRFFVWASIRADPAGQYGATSWGCPGSRM